MLTLYLQVDDVLQPRDLKANPSHLTLADPCQVQRTLCHGLGAWVIPVAQIPVDCVA